MAIDYNIESIRGVHSRLVKSHLLLAPHLILKSLNLVMMYYLEFAPCNNINHQHRNLYFQPMSFIKVVTGHNLSAETAALGAGSSVKVEAVDQQGSRIKEITFKVEGSRPWRLGMQG